MHSSIMDRDDHSDVLRHEIYGDDRYFEELNRMYQIVSEGRALNRAELLRDKTNDPLPDNPNR